MVKTASTTASMATEATAKAKREGEKCGRESEEKGPDGVNLRGGGEKKRGH
jgi:hypothetical protein